MLIRASHRKSEPLRERQGLSQIGRASHYREVGPLIQRQDFHRDAGPVTLIQGL